MIVEQMIVKQTRCFKRLLVIKPNLKVSTAYNFVNSILIQEELLHM